MYRSLFATENCRSKATFYFSRSKLSKLSAKLSEMLPSYRRIIGLSHRRKPSALVIEEVIGVNSDAVQSPYSTKSNVSGHCSANQESYLLV